MLSYTMLRAYLLQREHRDVIVPKRVGPNSAPATVGNVQNEVVAGPIPPMTAFAWRKSIRSLLGDTLTGTN